MKCNEIKNIYIDEKLFLFFKDYKLKNGKAKLVEFLYPFFIKYFS